MVNASAKKDIDYMKRFINRSQHYKHEIEEWQDFFSTIFSNRNKKISARFMWLKIVEKASSFSEAVRKQNFDDAAKAISRIFCWLCNFCSENKNLIGTGNLSEIIWNKYPYVCPHCANLLKRISDSSKKGISAKELGCLCQSEMIDEEINKGINEESLKYFRSNNKDIRPKHLDEWVKMFKDIYGSRINTASLESIAFHLFEEIGEVIASIRSYAELEELEKLSNKKLIKEMIINATNKYEKDRRLQSILNSKLTSVPMLRRCKGFLQSCIKEEIADVFSWMSASVTKITKMRLGYTSHDKRYVESRIGPGETKLKPAFSMLLDEMVPDKKELSTIVALEYNEGCTVCNNFTKKKKTNCTCESSLPPMIIG